MSSCLSALINITIVPLTWHPQVNIIPAVLTWHPQINIIPALPTWHPQINIIPTALTWHPRINIISIVPLWHPQINIISIVPTWHLQINIIPIVLTWHPQINIIPVVPTWHYTDQYHTFCPNISQYHTFRPNMIRSNQYSTCFRNVINIITTSLPWWALDLFSRHYANMTGNQPINQPYYELAIASAKLIPNKGYSLPQLRLGPPFSIKMLSYQYRKSHCGDKMLVRSSYLHNGISYTGKTASYLESGPRGWGY